ncbi:MAG TPA: hypothetical protein VHG89_13465 [Verrucomicrobiae bacterium]|nr:hypothetical protein [Verrucomicrobiae bacterium]
MFDDDHFPVMAMVAMMPMSVMTMMFFVRLDDNDFRRISRFRYRRKTIEDERQQYKCEQFFHGFDLVLMDYFRVLMILQRQFWQKSF